MTWRRIAIYYTLSILLGSYYFAFEWRPSADQPVRGVRAVQQSRFLPLVRDDIQELVLRSKDGMIHSRRNGQNWEVIEPQGTKITSALLASLVESLTADKEVQVVEQSASDFAPYGLAQPYSTIEIKTGEKDATTVFIGDHNPTQSSVYARKENSPQVVLLGYSVRYYEELIFEAATTSKS